MKKQIISIIKQVLGDKIKHVNIELINAKEHGDFSTNIAMKLASHLKDNPMNIANNLAKNITADFIEKVEVAPPGFINIFLKNDEILKIVKQINLQGQNYGKGKQGKYINVEYVSANPTGHLHLGHARGAAIGSSLVNILRFAGNKVDSEYYINDSGKQIDILAQSTFARYQELFGKNINLPHDFYQGQDIIETAKHIRDKYGDKFVDKEYKTVSDVFMLDARLYLLKIIKEDLDNYGVKIDKYSSEKEIYDSGQIEKTLKKLKQHSYIENDALWLKTTKGGDDKDRVLKKSDGQYTYFAPDIAYHDIKLARGYNELINIWGVDHIGYIKRLNVALEFLGLPQEKIDTLKVNLVKLVKNKKEIKMSKRSGRSYTIKELLNEVGKDAARWFMVDRSENSEFIFDVNLAKEKTNKNPVFTVQYTYARICQLIKKSTVKPEPTYYSKKEILLINELAQFPEIIGKIANIHKVNILTAYLLNITQKFNSWYSNTKAIGHEHESSMIALATAVQQVIGNGLRLLDILAPKKM